MQVVSTYIWNTVKQLQLNAVEDFQPAKYMIPRKAPGTISWLATVNLIPTNYSTDLDDKRRNYVADEHTDPSCMFTALCVKNVFKYYQDI